MMPEQIRSLALSSPVSAIIGDPLFVAGGSLNGAHPQPGMWVRNAPFNDHWKRGDQGTQWGVLPTPVTLTNAALESPIFKGFPKTFALSDEFYWQLRGDPTGITPLLTAPAGPSIASKPLPGPPKPEDLDGKAWPVMWTREAGKSRVFVSGVGHNYFTFNDPYFRIILLRAMAWTLHESFEPFKPLVNMHLER